MRSVLSPTNQKSAESKSESKKLLESFEDPDKLRELEIKYLKENQTKEFKDDSNNLLKKINYSKATSSSNIKNQLSMVLMNNSWIKVTFIR